MSRLALLPAAFLLSLGAASAAAFTPGAASAAPGYFGPPPSAVTLSAHAGVGGIARPGRWLPVDVTVRTDGGEGGAEVRVEWGDAVAVRDITLDGREQHIQLLLRAIAAAPVVHISFAQGTNRTAIDVPVELVSLEDPLTLCIGDVGNTACAVRVAEEAAPTTWRGFDVADTVIWPASAQSIRHDATRAFETWRAMRWLGDTGPADPVLPPFDTRTPAVSAMTARLAAIGLMMMLLAAAAAWRRAHLVLALGVPFVAGMTGAALLSPVGPAHSGVTSMQITGVVHQFAHTTQATVSAKADVEHASAAPLWLRPSLSDATLATSGPGTIHSASAQDDEGHALYRATAGVGARRRMSLEGTVDETWMDVTEHSTGFSISNRARFALTNCHWAGAMADAIGTVPPGATVASEPSLAPGRGDRIVCTLPNDWLPWTSSSNRVDVRGQMYFVFHFWPATL